jgi:hypothetical protein
LTAGKKNSPDIEQKMYTEKIYREGNFITLGQKDLFTAQTTADSLSML